MRPLTPEEEDRLGRLLSGQPLTFTYFRHTTQSDGRVLTEVEDNDDNDDGYPDGKVERYTLGPQSKAQALKSPMNRSHMGCAGREVKVWLDGKELT